MSSQCDIDQITFSISPQPWEIWARTWFRKLEASPAAAIHFLFETDTKDTPTRQKAELEWPVPDSSAADLMYPADVEEALQRGEDPFRIAAAPALNVVAGHPRPASLQALLRICKAFGTLENMKRQIFGRGTVTVIESGDPALNLVMVALLQDHSLFSPMGIAQRPCIMLCEDAVAADSRKSVPDIWPGLNRNLCASLQTCRAVVLIATDITSCPREIMHLQPQVLTLPRLDRALVLAHLRLSHSQTGRIAETLVLKHLPDDAALIRLMLEDFAGSLRRETPAEVADYLARRCNSSWIAQRFSDFPLEPDIRATIDQVLDDLRDWKRGELAWCDVMRGLLLAGPPGTGKTEIARLLAQEAGINLRAGSLADWQGSGDRYAGFLKAMKEFFAKAATAAPCIVFIDELDAVGDRGRPHDHNSSYTESVVTAVLEQLDGFASREGVILVAATNHPDRIDAAIRRPGRFDKTVHLRNPSPALMPDVFRWHLRADLLDMDMSPLAARAIGMSGADIAALIRDARARARKARQPLGIEDIEAAIATMRPMPTPGMRWRIAVHEGGHAIVADALGRGQPRFMALTGPGGVMEREAIQDEQTRDAYEAELACLMAGRAAETLLLGCVSAGAGGGAESDLARASAIACSLELSLGLGQSPVWVTTPERAISRLAEDPVLKRAVEARLHAAETAALDILQAKQADLNALARELNAQGFLDVAKISRMLRGN